jgi:hypothetical protein
VGLLLAALAGAARASDHLDTPTVTADPAADIGDVYAWTSADGRRLDLVMTIVGKRFSDRLAYVFHVDSGARFGKTTASATILCRFDAASSAQCWAGDADYVEGAITDPAGREGRARRFRVFAGLRDDPFFNNVKGTRVAVNTALGSLHCEYGTDAAGCPTFDAPLSQKILDLWSHTDGGPATNFLAGWSTAALVVSVDLDVVATGGPMLAVWGGVQKIEATASQHAMGSGDSAVPRPPRLGTQVDRAGRALTAQALVGLLATSAEQIQRKEDYNAAAPANWPHFVADLQATLPIYDALDGQCGNQWRIGGAAVSPERYGALATLLADDRLWIDSRSTVCERYLAVELAEADGTSSARTDCGGRTPIVDAIDVFRSLLVDGKTTGVSDGVDHDDHVVSTTVFPFLAAP